MPVSRIFSFGRQSEIDYMKILKYAGTLTAVFAVLSVTHLQAQPTVPMATQQAQNFQQNMEMQKPLINLRAGTNAPEIYQGENADIGEQHILRVLPRSTLFLLSVD